MLDGWGRCPDPVRAADLPSPATQAHAAVKAASTHIADPMTEEKNRGVPPSTQVAPFDLQLTGCAIEGHQDDGTQSPERRWGERRGAQASVSSNTVRVAVGELIGGRYRIERELG